MKRITEVTKQDILDLFRGGLGIDAGFCINTISYNYWGRLNELDFLKRLYDLKKLPSKDVRYANAEEDIRQHVIRNNDYSDCWVFEDKRFDLQNCDDEIYLHFLCEIFHPVVRDEKSCWKQFLIEINRLLRYDGYELYAADKISNRDVYNWRFFQKEESLLFTPYSKRNAKDIKEKKIALSIPREARKQIYDCFENYNEKDLKSGQNFYMPIFSKVFEDIRRFYSPKCFNCQNEYVETENFHDFIISTSPFCVFDAIELFAKYCAKDPFEDQINKILRFYKIPFKLSFGKMVRSIDAQINNCSLETVQEAGLKELLQDASKYYDENNLQIAVEKLWDAFERLKSYYESSGIDKKKSAEKIVKDMGGNQQEYLELFHQEFDVLTTLGNKFRIRHHETTKIDIQDRRYLEYFYKRCMSLISTAIQYLDGRAS